MSGTKKILFVDDKLEEFQAFLDLQFGQDHKDEIEFRQSPLNLPQHLQAHPEIRLVVLDILWGDVELGLEAMREIARDAPDVPVVIHTVLDANDVLKTTIPEAMALGAFDWVWKYDSHTIKSFRFDRAYQVGRDPGKGSDRRKVLPPGTDRRPNVHAAVMFADLNSFTLLTHELGTDETLPILREFYALVGRSVARHNGYVDKYIGDAVMAAFLPQSAEDERDYKHVRNCVEAARWIQTEAPAFRLNHVEEVLREKTNVVGSERISEVGRIRIGIESGRVDVVQFQRGSDAEVTFIGEPVNLASRIIGQAKAGEVWIGSNARNTGALAYTIEEDGTFEYKNLPGKYSAFRVNVPKA